MNHYDAVVVGLGIIGAATTWRASALNSSVLALDAGGPTHTGGSSHGATRIYRQAYWEGEAYLPMLALADQGWRDLERRAGNRLIVPSGGIFIGPRSTRVVAGSLGTARAGNIAHMYLDASDIRARFPQFVVTPDMEAVYEPGAYAILAENARLRMLDEAVGRGARLVYGERVVALAESQGHATITTSTGWKVSAGAVLVCAGAWGARLVPELKDLTTPHRVPIFWFEPKPGRAAYFGEQSFPTFLYEEAEGALLYGIPSVASAELGVKIGFHNRQRVPADPHREPPAIDAFEREIEQHVDRIFPDLDPSPRDAKWCFYTMSADESFIIDRSSQHNRVFYASACSGHGFKFAPAVGQALAELGLGLRPSVSTAHFGASRFGRPFG